MVLLEINTEKNPAAPGVAGKIVDFFPFILQQDDDDDDGPPTGGKKKR